MHLSLGPAGWLSGLEAGLQWPTGNNEPGEAGCGRASETRCRLVAWEGRVAQRAGQEPNETWDKLIVSGSANKSEDGRYLLGHVVGGDCLPPFAPKGSVGRCGWEGGWPLADLEAGTGPGGKWG